MRKYSTYGLYLDWVQKATVPSSKTSLVLVSLMHACNAHESRGTITLSIDKATRVNRVPRIVIIAAMCFVILHVHIGQNWHALDMGMTHAACLIYHGILKVRHHNKSYKARWLMRARQPQSWIVFTHHSEHMFGNNASKRTHSNPTACG